MKVSVENLGVLKKAEFEVGDLTVICGANNTGKTYATYALYGFINYWNEAFMPNLLSAETIDQLFNSGSIKVDLDALVARTSEITKTACSGYHRKLPIVFAADEKSFANTVFSVSLAETSIDVASIERTTQSTELNKKPIFTLNKKRGDRYLSINIVAQVEEIDKLDLDWITYNVNREILVTLFGNTFPSIFIASIERTGAAIFRKELDFTRNRLLEHVSNRDTDIDPVALIYTYYDGGYPLPVNRDVDFNRNLEDVVKYESVIAKDNPSILKAFDLILGGEYRSSKEGLHYIPVKSKVKLTLRESASSVRSLLNVGIYIRHIAHPGDILMIDEPELNLHPINQRRMARVLAQLVNAGVKVFITTHSDYILKEFNTLIMLRNMLDSSDTIARRVMGKHEYHENELLDSSSIKAYLAKKDLFKIEGATKKQWHNTFVPAPITEFGIEISDFDETINIMNEIQDELFFGGQVE